MTIAIVPFTEAHVEPAATLLANRHRRARMAESLLDSRFAGAANTLELVAQARSEAIGGLAALHDGKLAGYLLWHFDNTPPNSIITPFSPPDVVEASLPGLVVESGQPSVARRLYAAGDRWSRRCKAAPTSTGVDQSPFCLHEPRWQT